MLIIFWKWKVWNWLKNLLDFLKQINPKIEYEIMDDADYNEKKLEEATDIITSPWIPPHHKLYKNFQKKIISELTFTWKIIQQVNIKNKLIIVWISWTNWKSTTTHITYELFQKLKKTNPLWNQIQIHLSWNFWTPFSETLTTILQTPNKYHLIIIEVSSFMLYKIQDFSFDYSILTNIETDHLDRHSNLNNYQQTKLNLIKYTNKQAFTISKVFKTLTQTLQAKTTEYWHDYDLNWTQFIGHHNKANLQAVFLLTQKISKDFQLNFKPNTIKKQINNIKPLAHRLQLIKEIDWIKIYDDAICTSSHAQANADKWDSFDYLADLYKKKVIYWIFIWDTAPQFEKIFTKQKINYTIQTTLTNAIQESLNYARKENITTILFSPGCASFGMFKNVYDKINQFIEIIKNLK